MRVYFEKYVQIVKVFLLWAMMREGEGLFEEEGKQKFLTQLAETSTLLREIGLNITAKRVEMFAEAMTRRTFTWEKFKGNAAESYNVLRCECEEKLFLFIPEERAKFYEVKSLFGEAVARAFPSADFDIMEAGNCLAMGRNTACVFHLMRVLEIGLTTLAGSLSVAADRSSWQTIIEQIESRTREMARDANRPSDWKEQQEFYAQAAHHFMILKDAWRNYTAHARGKHDETEARRILENVQGFMQKLASRLREES